MMMVMKNNQDVYWTMKNGESISVDLMTRQHLINTLKRIILNDEQIKRKKEEYILNGEMAQDFNDSYPEDEEDLANNPFYNENYI
jgi:hypothetical protein